MPRGVYDRTKTKAQREAGAEKTTTSKVAKAPKKVAKAVAKAPKVPHTKKIAVENLIEKLPTKASISLLPEDAQLDTQSKLSIVWDNIATLTGAIQGLTGHSSIGSVVDKLDTELRANIEILTALRRQVFGLSEAEVLTNLSKAQQSSEALDEKEDEEDEEDEEDPAPVRASAAVPPYPQGTVPMPPAPVGVPPQ